MTTNAYAEYDTLMPAHSPNAQVARRTSRSSGSQYACRSSRIEKPRSNHNSPRTAERRKTTSGTKRVATLDDHYRMMFGGEEEVVEQRQSSRPFSWHPSSSQFRVPSRSSMMEAPTSNDWMRHNSESSRNSAHGSDFYSLSARSSMFPEQMQNFAGYQSSHDSTRGSQSTESSWPSYTLSTYSTPTTEVMPWYLQEWTRRNQDQSGNGSSDFLPIQHPSAEQDKDEVMEDCREDTGKELVGMGLYDPPESSLLWDGLVESTGKGLKLEETWQPPEDDEDAEEVEEEADDASSDDGSVEGIPPTKENSPAQPQPLDAKPQLHPTNMDGQSFFFDEDETYTKEWWFHQLKQPTVRDAGLGYGWL